MKTKKSRLSSTAGCRSAGCIFPAAGLMRVRLPSFLPHPPSFRPLNHGVLGAYGRVWADGQPPILVLPTPLPLWPPLCGLLLGLLIWPIFGQAAALLHLLALTLATPFVSPVPGFIEIVLTPERLNMV